MDLFFLEGNANYGTFIDYTEIIIRNTEILIWLSIFAFLFSPVCKGKFYFTEVGAKQINTLTKILIFS